MCSWVAPLYSAPFEYTLPDNFTWKAGENSEFDRKIKFTLPLHIKWMGEERLEGRSSTKSLFNVHKERGNLVLDIRPNPLVGERTLYDGATNTMFSKLRGHFSVTKPNKILRVLIGKIMNFIKASSKNSYARREIHQKIQTFIIKAPHLPRILNKNGEMLKIACN